METNDEVEKKIQYSRSIPSLAVRPDVPNRLEFKMPSIVNKTNNTTTYQPIDEILKLRFQLEELKQQRDELQEDQKKWVLVHRNIANLYLEVSGQTELEDEKLKLEKTDIVVIADYIRTEMRGLLGIKIEFDKEVKIELDKRKVEFDRQLQEEQRKCTETTKKNEELQQQMNVLSETLKEITNTKEKERSEAFKQYKQIEEELEEMKGSIQQKNTGIEEQQTQLSKLNQVIKVKDSKLSKLSDMEGRMQQLTRTHDSTRTQHQTEVQKLKEKCVVLQDRANYTSEAKKKLEDDLRSLNDKLIDIKKHNYFSDYSEAMKRIERQTQTIEALTRDFRRVDDEAKKANKLNESLSAKIKDMEREYGRTQFSSVPAIKKKEKQSQVVTEEQYRKVINESPHYVDAYKGLLREKETQIKDLTAKLRTLLVQANSTRKLSDSNEYKRKSTPNKLTSSSPPPQSQHTDSSPELWVNRQMQIIDKARTYTQPTKMQKENEPEGNDNIDDREEEDREEEEEEREENRNDGILLGPGPERERWMQGLKTPNMRTIKVLKSPSEKELSVISRNPLFNNASDMSKTYMKHKKSGGS